MPEGAAEERARKKLAVAFRAYKEGIHKHEYEGRRGEVLWNSHVKENRDGRELEIFVKRKELKGYLDEYFWSCLNVFFMTENMRCLPFSGGWAEQPAEITSVISLFRLEQSKWEKEEFEKKSKK